MNSENANYRALQISIVINIITILVLTSSIYNQDINLEVVMGLSLINIIFAGFHLYTVGRSSNAFGRSSQYLLSILVIIASIMFIDYSMQGTPSLYFTLSRSNVKNLTALYALVTIPLSLYIVVKFSQTPQNSIDVYRAVHVTPPPVGKSNHLHSVHLHEPSHHVTFKSTPVEISLHAASSKSESLVRVHTYGDIQSFPSHRQDNIDSHHTSIHSQREASPSRRHSQLSRRSEIETDKTDTFDAILSYLHDNRRCVSCKRDHSKTQH
jgi:hypothetical protein